MRSGELVVMRGTPFSVTVLDVSVCGENGCLEEVIMFRDPVTGEPDWAHSSEFDEHPLSRFDREDR